LHKKWDHVKKPEGDKVGRTIVVGRSPLTAGWGRTQNQDRTAKKEVHLSHQRNTPKLWVDRGKKKKHCASWGKGFSGERRETFVCSGDEKDMGTLEKMQGKKTVFLFNYKQSKKKELEGGKIEDGESWGRQTHEKKESTGHNTDNGESNPFGLNPGDGRGRRWG